MSLKSLAAVASLTVVAACSFDGNVIDQSITLDCTNQAGGHARVTFDKSAGTVTVNGDHSTQTMTAPRLAPSLTTDQVLGGSKDWVCRDSLGKIYNGPVKYKLW